jgi:hypothetical protein
MKFDRIDPSGQCYYNSRLGAYVMRPGGGVDVLDGFAPGQARLDLSAYGLSAAHLHARIRDRGWAVEVDLRDVSERGGEDRLFLTGLRHRDIQRTDFIL